MLVLFQWYGYPKKAQNVCFMDKLETKETKILRNKNLFKIQKYFSLSASRTLNWAERGGGVCVCVCVGGVIAASNTYQTLKRL